jgi:ribose 5-phosphate isomerase B
MKVALAADHAGWKLKDRLKARAEELGHEVLDLGTHGPESVDYPELGAACGRAVAEGRADRGVVVCGSGLGIAMAAGKVPGVRAATCHDHFTAEMGRRHNDANVMALGARVVGEGVALDALDTFLSTPFEGGRHERRVGQLAELDAASARSDS